MQDGRTFRKPEFAEFLTPLPRAHGRRLQHRRRASACCSNWSRALNRFADAGKLEDPATADAAAQAEFERRGAAAQGIGQILGLFSRAPSRSLGGDDKLVAGLMQLLIDLRNNLRAEAKKIAARTTRTKKMLFDQTDLIRKRLAELGVTLEDRPGGTTWRVG